MSDTHDKGAKISIDEHESHGGIPRKRFGLHVELIESDGTRRKRCIADCLTRSDIAALESAIAATLNFTGYPVTA